MGARRAPCSGLLEAPVEGRRDDAGPPPLLDPRMPQPSTSHVPPQNIEAEESVLGAMLVAEPALTRVIDEVKLNAADFYLDRHRAIFECAHDLYAESKPVDEPSPQDEDPRAHRDDPDAPWPVRHGSELVLKLYENSLAIAFAICFLLSIWLHAVTGAGAYSEDQQLHGGEARKRVVFKVRKYR